MNKQSDLIKRLRYTRQNNFFNTESREDWRLCYEAVDEIERLNKELKDINEKIDLLREHQHNRDFGELECVIADLIGDLDE